MGPVTLSPYGCDESQRRKLPHVKTAGCAAAPQFARLAGAGDQLSYPQNQARMGAFLQGLPQLGWIDGSSVRIDTRWPAGDAADTRKYAAELVALGRQVTSNQATVAPCRLFPKATVGRRKPPRRFGRIAGHDGRPRIVEKWKR